MMDVNIIISLLHTAIKKASGMLYTLSGILEDAGTLQFLAGILGRIVS